ncbi:hypothetical protein AB3N58_17510 (plasmid) [Leptospira sp. WS60.C2]
MLLNIKYIFLSVILVILNDCHTVSVKMGDEKVKDERIQHVSLQHYSTIMGWKEIGEPKLVTCPLQDGDVIIQEDTYDAIIYFIFAPFLISESIEIRCTDGT